MTRLQTGAALLFVLLGSGPALPERLEEAVGKVLDRPALARSTIGVLFVRLKDGEVVYAHKPDTVLPPASTTKLVTAAGTLALLGREYRFETTVVRTGEVKDGVLEGDLVLVASGDPNLSQRIDSGERLRYSGTDHSYAGFSEGDLVPGDPLVVIRKLARQTLESGVREIRGDVVVDDGLFEETDDDFVGKFSAVCVNDNLVDVVVSPAASAGARAEVRHQPQVPSVRVECHALTGPPGSRTSIWVEHTTGPAGFAVRGQIAEGSRPTLVVGKLANPAEAAAAFLGDLLRAEGVVIHGKERQGRFGPRVYRNYPVVARHVSPPLREALKVMLKVSQNLHATMFPVLVGALKGDRGDRGEGYPLIAGALREGGVSVDDVVLESGSGGGHADRVSARFLVELLEYVARGEDFSVFLDALPVGGVDGTLASHCRSPALRGRVRAKTGTLLYRGSFNDSWVYLSKALAGYLDVASGADHDERLAFAILIANTVTHDPEHGVEALFRAQEDILEAVLKDRESSQKASVLPDVGG